MSDAFNIDWVGKMKKNDSVVNGILNSPSEVLVRRVDKAGFYGNGAAIRPILWDSLGDALNRWKYDGYDLQLHEIPAEVNQLRLGDPVRQFSFWHYSAPKSIYNLHQPSLR